MSRSPAHELSRRERQIMDAVYALERAAVAEIRERLPDPPSYSAVRALVGVLEEKGHLTHERDGQRYVYRPVVPREVARRSVLRHLVETFFDGSTGEAVTALLDHEELDDDEVERLAARIDAARKEGR